MGCVAITTMERAHGLAVMGFAVVGSISCVWGCLSLQRVTGCVQTVIIEMNSIIMMMVVLYVPVKAHHKSSVLLPDYDIIISCSFIVRQTSMLLTPFKYLSAIYCCCTLLLNTYIITLR